MELTSPALPGYVLSDSVARLDRPRVHGWLVEAYWCLGIPRDVFERSLAHSLSFGIYGPEGQVAFARVVSDRATFAYLCDVIVDVESRGMGLGHWLVEGVRVHPDLQGLRRMLLATQDAHGLYAQHGFTPLGNPASWMEIRVADIYMR